MSRLTRISVIFTFVMLAMLFSMAGFAMPVNADSTVVVASDDAFNEALADNSVTAITIAYSPALIRRDVQISRPLKISGGGYTVTSYGGKIIVSAEGSVELENIVISSNNDYTLRSGGKVTLADGVSISGSYGIELTSGGSLTSAGRQIPVAASVRCAVGITSGECTLYDLRLTGSGTLVYVYQAASTLSLSGAVSLSTDNGTAIQCAVGGSAVNVSVSDNAVVDLYAPNAITADGYHGAALENYNGKITVGAASKLTATGSTTALRAAEIIVSNGASINASCTRDAGIGSSSAAVSAMVRAVFGDNVSITIGTTGSAPGNGIYGGEISFGSGCIFVMSSGSDDAYALSSKGSVYFGKNSSFQAINLPYGILCSGGLTFGESCNVEITNAKQYGIKATGTLIANKIRFENSCIINISAGFSAVYTNEALEFMHSCEATLEAGTKAPAVWVDTELDSQGHLLISGATINVKSKVNSSSVLNSGVYVVGAVTIDNGAQVTSICDGDFGIISLKGDINIGSSSKLYTSGSCGIYLKDGNLRLTGGGALYSEGKLDSGIRIEQGVLNIGDGAVVDAQGVRFGAELLGSGGVWINGASSFDFRSLSDRAIYIQNGSFNIESVERMSVWHRKADAKNIDSWWTVDTSGMRSWEIPTLLGEDQKIYADITKLAPLGAQSFRAGVGGDAPDLAWSDEVKFNLVDYSRLAMSKTRPTARSNSFNIPAGKTFSWWLYGESYYGSVAGFKAVGRNGGGEFTLSENGKFTYEAPLSLRGEQTFSFVTYDKDGLESEPATVIILVTASKPPTASGMTFETPMNTQLSSMLSVRDYDGSIAEVTVVDTTKHGELTVGSDGTFVYTPNNFYCGIDSFTYFATDNKGDNSPVAEVTIIIGMEYDAVAYNGTLVTDRDSSVSGTLTARAKINKYAETEDEKPFITQVVVTREPKYGTLVFDDTLSVTYTPFTDFAGTDSFTYKAMCSDGGETNEATVSLITVPNQKPSATSMSVSCLMDYKYSCEFICDDLDGVIKDYSIVSEPKNGTVTINSDDGSFTYVPKKSFTGDDSFTFTVVDDEGFTSREATVIISVRSIVGHLRAVGSFGTVLLIGFAILAGIIVLVIVLVRYIIKKKKQNKIDETELERDQIRQMIEFGDLNGLPQSILDQYRRQ